MSTFDLHAELARHQVVLTESHFLYTSGRHGSAYVNKDALYPHTQLMQQIGVALAAPFADVDVVVGPTIGGVVLSQWTAHALTQRQSRDVLACFSEDARSPEGDIARVLGRGYAALVAGKRVLVVEDIMTTGGSVRQVVEAVHRCGGNPIAVSALCNRGGVTSAMVGDVPLHALLNVQFDSWEPDECPLCRANVPMNTSVGKGGKR